MEITRARYRYDKAGKRPRRFRRVALGLVVLVMVVASGGYGFLALSSPVPALAAERVSTEVRETELSASIEWPAVGQAAIGSLDDGLLAATEHQEQQPIASLTKVITALAVLEKSPLLPGDTGPSFTVDQADVDSYRSYITRYGTVMGVNYGQRISQRDALVGLMLPSANNMADSLVRWVFGTESMYLTFANDMLQRYGLVDTVVADASGFHPGSRSTPADLIRLGQLALQNPVLSEIVSLKEHDIPGTGLVRNTNFLLYDDAVGIKTGNTDEAGNCLLFAVAYGPEKEQRLIGVVLGQRDRQTTAIASRALRDSALKNFGLVEVLPAGAVVGTISSAWGAKTAVSTAEPLQVYGWKGKPYEVEVAMADIEIPLLESQVVGRAAVVGREDAEVRLVTDAPLEGPGAIWRLMNYL